MLMQTKFTSVPEPPDRCGLAYFLQKPNSDKPSPKATMAMFWYVYMCYEYYTALLSSE